MKIRMNHTEIGNGYLVIDHATSSDGRPVFVDDDGNVFGPGDKFPRMNCNIGYLHKAADYEYTDDELQWVHDYIVRTNRDDCVRHDENGWAVWCFGATFKTAAQLEEIERLDEKSVVLSCGMTRPSC